MGRFGISAPDEVFDDLRLFAFKKGVSMNSIVVTLLMNWLEEEKKKYPEVFADEKAPKKPRFRGKPVYMESFSTNISTKEEK